MQYELQQRIRTLSDEELRQAISQGEEAFQEGVFSLYMQVYKERGLGDKAETLLEPEVQGPEVPQGPGKKGMKKPLAIGLGILGVLIGMAVIRNAPEIYTAITQGRKVPGDVVLIQSMKSSPYKRHFAAIEELFNGEFRQEIQNMGMMMDSETLAESRKIEIVRAMFDRLKGRLIRRAPAALVLKYEKAYLDFTEGLYAKNPQEACKFFDTNIFGAPLMENWEAWDVALEPAWRDLLLGAKNQGKDISPSQADEVLRGLINQFVEAYPQQAQTLRGSEGPKTPEFYQSFFHASKTFTQFMMAQSPEVAALGFKAFYNPKKP